MGRRALDSDVLSRGVRSVGVGSVEAGEDVHAEEPRDDGEDASKQADAKEGRDRNPRSCCHSATSLHAAVRFSGYP